jgi:hypothetical protein
MTTAREIIGALFDEGIAREDAQKLIESALLAERRLAIDDCAKEGIACAHELKRNADLEAEDSPERCALLSRALIAWDVVARIRWLMK